MGLVGLGIISETHLAVLAGSAAGRGCVFTVDPQPTGRRRPEGRAPRPITDRSSTAARRPRRRRPARASPHPPRPTPTLVTEALSTDRTPGCWSRSRWSTTSTALERLRGLAVDRRPRRAALGRSSFRVSRPEVRWAADLLGVSTPTGAPSRPSPAPSTTPTSSTATSLPSSYGSSWTDSGINQLSMLTRFVDLDTLAAQRPTAAPVPGAPSVSPPPRRSAAWPGCAPAGVPARAANALRSRSPTTGVEIWIDHTAMTGFASGARTCSATLTPKARTPARSPTTGPSTEIILRGAHRPGTHVRHPLVARDHTAPPGRCRSVGTARWPSPAPTDQILLTAVSP